MSLDLPNSYRYPGVMTVVANVLSRSESTRQKEGTFRPILNICMILECLCTPPERWKVVKRKC